MARRKWRAALEERVLEGSFELHFRDKGIVTVDEVLRNPGRFNCERLADPNEPDYAGDLRHSSVLRQQRPRKAAYLQPRSRRRPRCPRGGAHSMSLPANPEAERIVCATFMAHNHLFEVYINRIKPEDFTVPVHQQIMRIGLRLLVENKPANRTTIASRITELSPTLDLSVPEYLSRPDARSRARTKSKPMLTKLSSRLSGAA